MSTRLVDYVGGEQAAPAAPGPATGEDFFATGFDLAPHEEEIAALLDAPAITPPQSVWPQVPRAELVAPAFATVFQPAPAATLETAYEPEVAPAALEQPYEADQLPPAFEIAYAPDAQPDYDYSYGPDVFPSVAESAAPEPVAGGTLGTGYASLYAELPVVPEPLVEAEPPVVSEPPIAVSVADWRDEELSTLKDRLSYYDAFDSLISDNIKRSAELFHSLYEERERVKRESDQNKEEIAAAATLEAERRLGAERQRFQNTLMSLMDEASRMQRQIDGLIQRIAEAITESTVRLADEPVASSEKYFA